MDFAQQILLIQAIATWFVLGLIAFVQIVHYPLLENVGESEFKNYEKRHVFRTTLVVGGPMLIELFTATISLFIHPPEISSWVFYLGFLLLLIIWASSFGIQVPQHKKLSDGFQKRPWEILVKSNWIRTFAWSVRALMLTSCFWFLAAG